MMRFPHVLVTGGAGYVGAELVPSLIRGGHRVTVLDWFLYRGDLFSGADPRFLTRVKGDLRDRETVRTALTGVNAVIHLACISNDPSAELDQKLTEDVNQNAFEQLVEECLRVHIQRFIFASSSSIYGISNAPQVFEDHPRVPVSAYNISKAWCEDLLEQRYRDRLPYVVVRPATLCGYSARQRLDLTVNILTAQAITKGEITIFGGSQYRPSLNLRDCVRLYEFMLQANDSIIFNAFNASQGNFSVTDIAETIVKALEPVVGPIAVTRAPTNDLRSYRVNTDKLTSFGFEPRLTIKDAVQDLLAAFATGKLRAPIEQAKYNNVKMMIEKSVN